MRSLGFTDARVTASGADSGIDVIAAGAVAQVKAHQIATPRPEVQRLKGAATGYGDVLPIFYSLSGYTAGAIKWAEGVGVALFVLESTGVARAVTREAIQLVEASYARGPEPWQPVAGWGTLRYCALVRNDRGGTEHNCLFIPDDGGKPRPLIYPVKGNDDQILSMLGEYARGIFDLDKSNFEIEIAPEGLAEYETIVSEVNAMTPANRARFYAKGAAIHRDCGYGWDPEYHLVKMAPGFAYQAEDISRLPRSGIEIAPEK
jgi:hypothetical protein